MLSVIIPVYRNAEFVPALVAAFEQIADRARREQGQAVEFVFVVDGSPDDSHARLAQALPAARFASQLVEHSRNFGSFAAIRTGLQMGRGDHFAVIAADLQEPPELLLAFLTELAGGRADVVVGRREGRDDPALSRASANAFWGLYRRLVNPEIPEGGVDVFGCTRQVRDELLALPESHSSLVGQLYWLGFRRAEVPYRRRAREHGKSAWTFRKKLRYLSDSIFAFTDLPIRLLLVLGGIGLALATVLGTVVLALRLAGVLQVPGYAATILVILFFGALNVFSLGLVGAYAARAFENTKNRPIAVARSRLAFGGAPAVSGAPQAQLMTDEASR